MVLPRKHYSTYAHAGGPRHATQTDAFDRTASSLVALVINLMVTDFYLETPHVCRQVRAGAVMSHVVGLYSQLKSIVENREGQ